MSLYTSMLCRAYTGLVTSGSFLPSFLNTTVNVILEHVWGSTPLLCSESFCPMQSKSPIFSTHLGPATSTTSTLPPFLLLIYSSFLGPNKHAITSMLLLPLIRTQDFQWASSPTHLRSLLGVHINIEAFLIFPTFSPYPTPTNSAYPALLVYFYAIATHHQLFCYTFICLIICIWKECTLHKGSGSFIHCCLAISIQ